IGELERIAGRVEALRQVLLGGAALLDVDQAFRHLAKRGLDGSLVAGERLLAPRLRLVDARLAAAAVEDGQRERVAERPDAGAAREQVAEGCALRAGHRGKVDG